MMRRHLPLLLVLLCVAGASGLAQTITGTVTNRTTGKAAAGDDVVLIRLAQGMQESVRTKTDAHGRYSLELPDAGLHLVRVTHDKANYFKPAPPGTTAVDMDVYNAASKVAGVTGEADVMRLQTDESGKQLKVVENFFVKNDSKPPMTQFSDRPFEFYLPAGAVVEGSAALAPGGMPVQASPVPLGDPNHYAFLFPIRPGETRFQVSYHLPYTGEIQIAPHPVLRTDTVAVMLPKSIQFQGATGAPYSSVPDDVSAQTFVARDVTAAQPLGFVIKGTGQMPRDTPVAANDAGAGGPGAPDANAGAGGSASADTRPGGGLGNPVDPGATNDPWAKYRWWILGGLGLLLAAGAGVMLRRPSEGGRTAAARGEALPGDASGAVRMGGGSVVMHALKEELFTLETERLQGTISDADYTEHKTALERVLRRALAREGVTAGRGNGPEAAEVADRAKAAEVAPDLVARSGMKP